MPHCAIVQVSCCGARFYSNVGARCSHCKLNSLARNVMALSEKCVGTDSLGNLIFICSLVEHV